MDFLAIVFIFIGVISYLNKKKRKEDEARKKAAQARAFERQMYGDEDARPRTPARPTITPTVEPPLWRGDIAETRRASHAKKAEELAKRREELRLRRQKLITGESSLKEAVQEQVKERLAPEQHNELGSTLVSDLCAVEHDGYREEPPVFPARSNPVLPFAWDRDELVRGIVLSEVLGRPKALRR